MAILLIPNKSDSERELVAAAWLADGGQVLRIDQFWKKPSLPEHETVALYGNDTFCLVLAQVLGLQLCIPDDAWIAQLPFAWIRRNIRLLSLGELADADFPCFAKPIQPKQFKAQVYANLQALREVTAGIPDQDCVLLSEIVTIEAEVRAFVWQGRVLDAACYAGAADLADAMVFAQQLCDAYAGALPASVVIDLALVPERVWMILEFNAAWGAGLNGCDPTKVLPAIAAATLK